MLLLKAVHTHEHERVNVNANVDLYINHNAPGLQKPSVPKQTGIFEYVHVGVLVPVDIAGFPDQ